MADGRLSCQLCQRCAGLFLGVPINIASHALLILMVVQVTGYRPEEFVHTLGDAHLNLNHLEQADRQLKREPLPLLTLRMNSDVTDLFSSRYGDFRLEGYEPHPWVAAPVSI